MKIGIITTLIIAIIALLCINFVMNKNFESDKLNIQILYRENLIHSHTEHVAYIETITVTELKQYAIIRYGDRQWNVYKGTDKIFNGTMVENGIKAGDAVQIISQSLFS